MNEPQNKNSNSSSGVGGNLILRFENFHILLWLVKDTCWLLEWRVAGTVMIIPTVLVAVFIAAKTFRQNIFWVNLAICFWISANGYWMLCEFFEHVELKQYAIYPFCAGLISVSVFFIREFRKPTTD